MQVPDAWSPAPRGYTMNAHCHNEIKLTTGHQSPTGGKEVSKLQGEEKKRKEEAKESKCPNKED